MGLLINGKAVDDATIDAEFSNIKAYHESLGNVSCCERDGEFRGYARQNVVARALLAEEALRRVPPASDDEIEAALAALREQHGEAAFNLMAQGAPGQLDLLRGDIDTHLRTERMLGGLGDADGEPTDGELRTYYERNVATFTSPERVRASHISKNPGRGEERAAAYEALRTVRRQLLAGGDFEALAREHSDKGQELIDLGFFKRGEMPEEFELVAFSMADGEISPVFSSSFGYHIAKVTGHEPPAPRPFDEVREDVRKGFLEERRQTRMRELVEELKARAVIEETGSEGEGGGPEAGAEVASPNPAALADMAV